MGLEDLCEYGGANADGIKKAHEKVFSSLPTDIYTSGMTSATADGASVNFGRCVGRVSCKVDCRRAPTYLPKA